MASADGSGTDWTLIIAIYGASLASLGLLWEIFKSAIRDRPRVYVKPIEGFLHQGAAPEVPVFSVRITNRGRRPVKISHVSRFDPETGTSLLAQDFYVDWTGGGRPQLPVLLAASDSATVMHGARGGHTQGGLGLDGWYATDAASRVYPLRQRWRIRWWHVRRGRRPWA